MYRRETLAFLLSLLLFSGCGYTIRYRLNDKDVVKAEHVLPFRLQVAKFTDKRNQRDIEKSAREAQGFNDSGDYTYDKQFRGEVSESISSMVVEHLRYSGLFTDVAISPYNSAEVDQNELAEIGHRGYDAVLVGDLESFYGYYDHNVGREILYGLGLGLGIGIPVTMATLEEETTTFPRPLGRSIEITETKTNPVASTLAVSAGTSLGFYLESLHKRKMEGKTKLNLKLLGTSDARVLWHDTLEFHIEELTSKPGINTSKRKFELAVESLRQTVNEMVRRLALSEQLSQATIPSF